MSRNPQKRTALEAGFEDPITIAYKAIDISNIDIKIEQAWTSWNRKKDHIIYKPEYSKASNKVSSLTGRLREQKTLAMIAQSTTLVPSDSQQTQLILQKIKEISAKVAALNHDTKMTDKEKKANRSALAAKKSRLRKKLYIARYIHNIQHHSPPSFATKTAPPIQSAASLSVDGILNEQSVFANAPNNYFAPISSVGTGAGLFTSVSNQVDPSEHNSVSGASESSHVGSPDLLLNLCDYADEEMNPSLDDIMPSLASSP